MIGTQARLAAVLGRDESLVEVLAGLSPVFERLRDPETRRVMSRLITLEEAARIGGVDAEELIRRLDGSARPATPGGDEMTGSGAGAATAASGLPQALRGIPADKLVEVDVREELRAGREPFSLIMAARHRVPEGGALSVRAIFEPVPLYAVLAKQGLVHHSERLGEADWRVWFYPAEAAPAGAEGVGPGTAATGSDEEQGVVVLDVRDLEPPEPMVRTLAVLEQLPPGGTLLHINVRVPQFLLPQLEQRGFSYEIREQKPDLVRVFIRRAQPDSGTHTPQPKDMLMKTERTLDVRVIPPREKHPAIFDTFASLAPGESFVLVNDHDPKPLRYQFDFEHRGEFDWKYLEQGPSVWRVEISRTAK